MDPTASYRRKRPIATDADAAERLQKRQEVIFQHSSCPGLDLPDTYEPGNFDSWDTLVLSQTSYQPPSDPLTDTCSTPFSNSPGFTNEICYGMICNVNAKLIDDPNISLVHNNKLRTGSSGLYQLRIVKKNIYILQTEDGTDVAVLNKQASKALEILDHESLARYLVYVTAKEWVEKMRLFRSSGKQICLEPDIYLFGKPSNGKHLGRVLSDLGLFLQPPDFLEANVIYENPHEIKFLSWSETDPEAVVPPPSSLSVSKLSTDAVDCVLRELHQQELLDVVDIDKNIILTELERHQKEALDFIFRRESDYVPESLSLFKTCVDPHNRTFFEHVIMGYKTPEKPTEGFGGIIADEMGLGKTLLLLSAVAMSLTRAMQFAELVPMSGQNRVRSRATLVICPSVLLMDSWEKEISRHLAQGAIRYLRYHGASKATVLEMTSVDLVLTTYATLTADAGQHGILCSIHWFRIVLDEAHSIRHQQTKQFRAVMSLLAKQRWCLSGTPIQNSVSDLGALTRFLRVPHMDASHSFQSHIAGPIERGEWGGVARLRLRLKSICLRRTKELLELPAPIQQVERVYLTTEEKEHYQNIGRAHRQAIEDAISRRCSTEAYRGLFKAIMQLRIFCNTGTCDVDSGQSPNEDDSPEASLSLLEQSDGAFCAYCSCDISSLGVQEGPNPGILLNCSHLLCLACALQYRKGKSKTRVSCPECQKVVTSQYLEHQPPVTPSTRPITFMGHSSKLEVLLQNLLLHSGEKSIVFSSWRKSIHLVASYLNSKGIYSCLVDGSMSMAERREQLSTFQTNPSISVLLMTLGTGAVGLNLTVANRIHILEPQWNPYVEKQAIGRAVRIGQQKQVTVVRYVAQNTVEQYVQTKQEKKIHLGRIGWDENAEHDAFKDIEDLKSWLYTE